MERGKLLQRRLDTWVGIPLVMLAGCARTAGKLIAAPWPAAAGARRIGVLCLGAIGDLLLATALLDGLRRTLPEAEIEVVTSRANAACCALLPAGVASASFAVTDIPGLVRHLRTMRYDILFDTGQWARISALVAACSGAGCTVGFSTAGQYRHYAYDYAVEHRNDRHETENFLSLGRALFSDLTGSPTIHLPPAVASREEKLGRPFVVCHMWPSGLHSRLKEWPAEHWADLAASLVTGGYCVAFTGGPQDVAATEAFMVCHFPETRAEAAYVFSLAGSLSLPDLARYMKTAAAVISVNTGIMHLAAIAGAPTVALNGPTNPLRWGPVGPCVASLLPEAGHAAYLNLGFEYDGTGEMVLRHLPVDAVGRALAQFGVATGRG